MNHYYSKFFFLPNTHAHSSGTAKDTALFLYILLIRLKLDYGCIVTEDEALICLCWNPLVSPTRSVRDLRVYIDALTSQQQSVHALLLFVRFIAWGILCQDAPCYHWSTHSPLARLTTVTRFWPEYPEISRTGYSPSWILPHVSYLRRGDQTTSCCYSANGIGWRSRRRYSSGSACWLNDACTALHRHTSPSHYNWSVTWTLEDAPLTHVFNVAGPRIWNLLPEEITSAQSLSMFRQRLKTFLFEKSYPGVILWSWNVVVCWLFYCYFLHFCSCVFLHLYST